MKAKLYLEMKPSEARAIAEEMAALQKEVELQQDYPKLYKLWMTITEDLRK